MDDHIQVANVEGVGIAIGTGASVNVYGDIHYYPIKLKAPLRDVFQPLIDNRSKLFGGRTWAFEKIAEFIHSPKGGYLVITAPAGFGKTALLANLVSRTPKAFAYHFFTPLHGEDTLTELFFLRNIVEQMAHWHNHTEELPTKINDLRALFHHFVDEPLDRTQVLVIDGLDEVSTWRLAPYLSRPLPQHLHLITSVRAVGQDWREIYGIPAEQLQHLPLEGLAPVEVADVLRNSGPTGAAFANDAEQLAEVCTILEYETDRTLGADPFYTRYLAEDISDGRVTAENLRDQPRGLEAYLDAWWQEIKRLAGDAATRDLFGTLAAALGPIGRRDLEAVCPSLVDDWAGDFFDEVLTKVRRQVVGDEESGYALAHPRLRTYLADAKRIGKIDSYRDRLVTYCASWRTAPSDYMMNHYVAHLSQLDDIDALYTLFDGHWMAAQFTRLGSYSRLVSDLDLAIQAHHRRPNPDSIRITAMAVARQTAREIILNFPIELLEAQIHLGQIKQVLTMLEALNSTKGRAANPLARVARELLQLQSRDEKQKTELPALSVRLLDRAVDLIPKQRSANQKMKATANIASAIAAGRELTASTRERLVRDTLAHLEASGDATLTAIGIGQLAGAMLAHDGSSILAAKLLQSAWPIYDGIRFLPDRTAIAAYLLPAVQRISPAEALPLLETLLDAPETLLEHSSLIKNPILRLLNSWKPCDEMDRAAAIAVLDHLAELPYRYPDNEYGGLLVSACCEKFLEMGLVDQAAGLIERIMGANRHEGHRVVMSSDQALFDTLPDQTIRWLEAAEAFTAPRYYSIAVNRELYAASLAESFAVVGNWERAATILSSVRPRERADSVQRCIQLAADRFSEDPPLLTQRIDDLLDLIPDVEPEQSAKTTAVAAKVLAASDLSRSRALATKATALCLMELPEGDNDELRNLQAHAHHLEGDNPAAARIACSMKWITSTLDCLTHLISCCEQDDAVSVDLYAEHILETLRKGSHRSLFADAVITAAMQQRFLMRHRSEAALALDDYLNQMSTTLSWNDFVRIRSALAASYAPVDARTSAERFRELIFHNKRALENGIKISADAVARIYREVAGVADQLAPAIRTACEPLDPYFEDPGDLLRIHGALAELTAAFDCPEAAKRLADLMGALDRFREMPPGAIYLSKMLADFTGRKVGPRMEFVRAINTIGANVTSCAAYCPEVARRYLADLHGEILTIDDSPNDLAQGLVDLCHRFTSLDRKLVAWVAPVLMQVVEQAKTLPDDLLEYVMTAAVQAMLALEKIDMARTVVDELGDHPWKGNLSGRIDIAKERLALGELSVFDEAFVNLRNSELAVAVLHSIEIDKEDQEINDFLCDWFASEELAFERGRLLSEFVPMMAAPLRAIGGTNAIGALVDAIESFDHHFQNAARWIDQGA